MALACNKS